MGRRYDLAAFTTSNGGRGIDGTSPFFLIGVQWKEEYETFVRIKTPCEYCTIGFCGSLGSKVGYRSQNLKVTTKRKNIFSTAIAEPSSRYNLDVEPILLNSDICCN